MTRASIGAGAEGGHLPEAGRRSERTMVMQDRGRRERVRSRCRREPSRPVQATMPHRPRPRSRMARAGGRVVLRRRAANVGLSNGAREIDWLMSGGKEPAGLGVSRRPVRSGTQFLLTGSIPATRCRRVGIGPPFLGDTHGRRRANRRPGVDRGHATALRCRCSAASAEQMNVAVGMVRRVCHAPCDRRCSNASRPSAVGRSSRANGRERTTMKKSFRGVGPSMAVCLICTACFAASPAAAYTPGGARHAHPSRSAPALSTVTVQPTANGGDRPTRCRPRSMHCSRASASCSRRDATPSAGR